MENRPDLKRSMNTLEGLLPGGPDETKTVKGEVLPTHTVYAPINDDDDKAALKIKRMEERTKRIGIRQGEKTRRVEARNKNKK